MAACPYHPLALANTQNQTTHTTLLQFTTPTQACLPTPALSSLPARQLSGHQLASATAMITPLSPLCYHPPHHSLKTGNAAFALLPAPLLPPQPLPMSCLSQQAEPPAQRNTCCAYHSKVALRFCCVAASALRSCRPREAASGGGTALPTCLWRLCTLPLKKKWSGKPCSAHGQCRTRCAVSKRAHALP